MMQALTLLAASASAYVLPSARCPSGVTRVARCESPGMASSEKERKRRLDALVTGTNWPPRTIPEPGKGYFFFQGPTPKTSFQKDLPSFFSSENFADIEIKPIQLVLTGTGFGSLFLLLASLNGGFSFKAPELAAPAPVSKPAPPKKDEKAAEKKAAEIAAEKE